MGISGPITPSYPTPHSAHANPIRVKGPWQLPAMMPTTSLSIARLVTSFTTRSFIVAQHGSFALQKPKKGGFFPP